MQAPSAPAALLAAGGAFAFGVYSVSATVNAGPAGSLRAGQSGVSIGRFGWADQSGAVRNQRSSPNDLIGLVLPQIGPGVDWRRVFYDEETQTYKIREGMNMAMLASGIYQVQFPDGAVPGQAVYANPLDGTAFSGYSPDGELAPWSVVTAARPGEIAIISTRRIIG